ncbi:BEACH domain-containing protein [Lentinula edodes]|nr:BEACH domain-containing protein [Lentinula edodes]
MACQEPNLWWLDEIEGPHRVSWSLKATNLLNVPVEEYHRIQDVVVPETNNSSVITVEVPPWAKSYKISLTDMEDLAQIANWRKKFQKTSITELEPEDVIESVGTVARVAGVDPHSLITSSTAGLLIIGRTHVYTLDGLAITGSNSDIAQAYKSVARNVRGDVQELILEFFNCLKIPPTLISESSRVQQNTGERIHDVKLPPWAKQDPWLFIIIMNHKASESLYISKNLLAWIDLIWGHNLRDPAALNVFHPLSYEGSIDLGSIMDELEREATVGIIHNFGQTPRKLFTTPHPNHYNYDVPILPIGTLHGIEDDAHPLVQVSRCFKDSGPNVPVTSLVLDMIGEKILPCPAGVLFVPWHPHELEVEWAMSCTGAKEVRVVVDHKVVQVIEGSFCYSNNLVTGSSDHTVRLWTMSCAGGHLPLNVSQEHIMRAHTDEVVSVAACRAWSVIVSGSRDGSMALWNLNRAVYVQCIWHGEGG